MTEAVEADAQNLNESPDQTPPETPLAAIQRMSGAMRTERRGRSIIASYGDVLLEYAAVREGGAGLIDLSAGGRILVSGSEAVPFLNGLITNDMKTLAVNSWMPAAFPNVQGRLIASVRIIRLQDEQLDETAGSTARRAPEKASPVYLIDTEPATHERLLKTIERFTLAGDFRVRDITETTALLTVQGRKARTIVQSVLGDALNELARDACCEIPRGNYGLTVIRASHTEEDGFDLIVDSDHAAALWSALQDAGARPVGDDALEILRIEAGRPLYGVDMDETNVVTEALEETVSYTKGCYVGQEIIARIKYRGHVAKKLAGFVFPQAAEVTAGAVIRSTDNKEIGRVTSATFSPHLGRTVALGYLKFDYLAADTPVRVVSDDQEFQGTVAALPLVQGSWQAETTFHAEGATE